MELNLYSVAASIFLLAILLVLLPLKLTGKGKSVVFISGTIISLLWYLSSFTIYSKWVILPILILLIGLISYILLQKIHIFQDVTDKSTASETPPLFSYETLVEKANKAVTIDDYYTHPSLLKKKGDMEESLSSSMGQAEIDRLLSQHRKEAAVSSVVEHEQVEPTSTTQQDSLILDIPLNEEKREVATIDEDKWNIDISQEDFMEKLEYTPLDLEDPLSISSTLDDMQNKEDSPSVLEDNFSPSQPDLSDSLLDEIDFEQRHLAALEDFHEENQPVELEELTENISTEDEDDLIEVRKKMFAHLEDDLPLADELVPETREEVQSKVEERTPFSSPKLEAVFEDLEEYYLKQKERMKEEKNEI